jgi:hypothetical protein
MKKETNTPHGDAMKFIIKGSTFDTATSTTVALSRGAYTPDGFHRDYTGAEQVRYEEVLYRTAKGAWFVHLHHTIKYPKGKPVVHDAALALSAGEAIAWISGNGASIIDATGLDLPEEA